MSQTKNPITGVIMPVNMGVAEGSVDAFYSQIYMHSVSYVTDKDALASLLPSPLEPADIPLVQLNLGVNSGVNFLAGGGYNVLGVTLSAVFKGEKDYLEAGYTPVFYENDTYPIILGRELLGVPKIYADIPNPKIDDNYCSFYCAEYGTRLIEAEIRNLQPVDESSRKALEQRLGTMQYIIGWRYLKNMDNEGEGLSQLTATPYMLHVEEILLGEGTHRFYVPTFEQAPVSTNIMKQLSTLKVVQYQPARVVKCSEDLYASKVKRLV